MSFAQDHWGFINDAVSNTQLIPTYYENNFDKISGASRNSSWPAMRGGSIKKVTYPTGGSTEYEFEANNMWLSYPKYNDVSRYSGDVGFSGNETLTSSTQTLSANPYNLTLSLTTSNPNTTEYAVASIYKVGNPNVHIKSITVNKDKLQNDVTFQSGSGSYFVTLNIYNRVSGDGASTTLFEKIPYNYSGNDIVGGLRISKITTHDGIRPENDIVQNFNYNTTDGHSTGVVYSRPRYVQVYRNDIVAKIGISSTFNTDLNYTCSPNGCLDCDITISLPYHKSSGSLRPMQTTQGNHIGYNEVKVSQTGNGYTIYRYWGSEKWNTITDAVYYNNVQTIPPCDGSLPSYPYPPLQPEFKRGDLKEVWQYSNAGVLLKETFYENTYKYNDEYKTANPALKNEANTPGMIVVLQPATISTQYVMKTYRKISSKTVERLHSVNGVVINTTELFYESPYHHQATRQKSTLANGDILETKYKYAADFRTTNPACDATSDVLGDWETDSTNLTNTYFNTDYVNCPNLSCKYLKYLQYQLDFAYARQDYLADRRTNYMNSNSTFNTCISNAKQNAGTSLKPILEMQQKGLNPVIETTSWKNGQLIDAGYNNYAYSTETFNSSIVYIDKTQNLNLAAPAASFTNASVDGLGQNITKNANYQDETSLTFNTGNIARITGKDGVTKSFIWDYRHTLPTAQIINANPDQAAYTSFETYESGNWAFLPVSISASDAFSGKKVFQLGGANGNISKTGLIVNNAYIISYWSKNNSPYTISNVTNIKTPVTGTKSGAWTCYTHYVTATATTIEISGAGFIDELRLHPQNALMESYTYTPLLGISSKNDNGNRISYFEYDPLGRLKIVRDANKFILSRYCYNYAGQAVNCDSKAFYSAEKRNTFTRNNCSPVNGGTYEYIVPAGKYSSDVSQQAADDQATNELNLYGQAAANQNAPCLVDVSVNYTTYTGSGISGYHVKFTNTDNRNLEYEFIVTGTATSGTLGTIPTGVYDINIFKPNSALLYNFWVQPCGFGQENSSTAQIYHVNITTSCKTIEFQETNQ